LTKEQDREEGLEGWIEKYRAATTLRNAYIEGSMSATLCHSIALFQSLRTLTYMRYKLIDHGFRLRT